MSLIKLPYNFTPRDYQTRQNNMFFVEHKRHFIDVLHRRAGKTKNALNFMLGAALQHVGLYYHCFPEFAHAKRVIFKNVDHEGRRFIDHIPSSLIKGRPNETDLRIELQNGSTLQWVGSNNYNKLVGPNPSGIIYDEFALQSPRVRDFLSPILAQNKGWEYIIFTPRGRNHAYKLYEKTKNNPEWFVQLLTVDDTKNFDGTPVISKEAIDELRKEGMREEIIQQEFYCSFDSPNPGVYYKNQLVKAHTEKRIRDFPIDPRLPVFTFWDLGVSDSTAIWFMQVIGSELRLINYYENQEEALGHYINYLGAFAERYKITYQKHFAPHDIKVRQMFAAQLKSRYELARQMGLTFSLVPNLPIVDGIEAVRYMFRQFIFHKTNCAQGLEAIRAYKRKYDEKSDKFHDYPEHNWASHGADALRYLAVGWYSFHNPKEFRNHYDRKIELMV